MFWSFLIWLLSMVFYMWVIIMIVQRLFFYNLTPGELTPTYWIGMGAVPSRPAPAQRCFGPRCSYRSSIASSPLL